MSRLLYKYRPELVPITQNAHLKANGILFLIFVLPIILTVSFLWKYPFICMGMCIVWLFIVVNIKKKIDARYYHKSSQATNDDYYIEIYTDKLVCRQRSLHYIFKVVYDTCEIYYDEIQSSIITEDNELKITLKKLDGNRKSSYTYEEHYNWFYIRIFGYPNELRDKILDELRDLLQLSYLNRRRS